MKKIIHLTDLHLGFTGLDTRFSDLVTRLIYHKQPADQYVVVITGDIVENAGSKDSYARASVHLDRIRQAGFSLLLVPGNHDYGPGSVGNSKYIEMFKLCFFDDVTIRYPKLDIIGNIAFIGLDSMAEEVHWYDRLFAEGELGGPQLKRLNKMLKSRKVTQCVYTVVYLHHHPLNPLPFHQLKDSEALRETLHGYRIDALLFGHNHNGLVWNGGWGIRRVYDGGTSTAKRGRHCPHRVIDLSQEPSHDYDAKLLM